MCVYILFNQSAVILAQRSSDGVNHCGFGVADLLGVPLRAGKVIVFKQLVIRYVPVAQSGVGEYSEFTKGLSESVPKEKVWFLGSHQLSLN